MTRQMLKYGFALLPMVTAAFISRPAAAQCPAIELTPGLEFPLGIVQTNDGNFVVSESGPRGARHSGRISIVDPAGNRATLIDGLPSAPNDVGDPSGPAGVYMRGRTLYVAIGIGNNVFAPVPRTQVVNPDPWSPIFSSVLAIHFSVHTERMTSGFSLTEDDQDVLASGRPVRLSNGSGDTVDIELITNLPDYVLNPPPNPTSTVRAASNPFDLVVIGDQLYVTDGGMNSVWQVDIPTGAASPLVEFPAVSNPMFPMIGGPFVEAVPTGITTTHAGQLLVTLFRGFPFPAGTSSVEQVDPVTGTRAAFIEGLKTAIDVLAVRSETVDASHDVLVLQHASSPVLFAAPGTLARIDGQTGAATVIADCLNRPTSMARDAKSGATYITELLTGRLVVVP